MENLSIIQLICKDKNNLRTRFRFERKGRKTQKFNKHLKTSERRNH